MSALEMSTAARAGLPVKFFVLDDGAYHYMQMFQEPTFRRTTATELARVDFAAYAAGDGAGLQRDPPGTTRLPAGVARAIACHPGADPDPGGGELRGSGDPLARTRRNRRTSAISPATRSSGWARGSLPDRSIATRSTIDWP